MVLKTNDLGEAEVDIVVVTPGGTGEIVAPLLARLTSLGFAVHAHQGALDDIVASHHWQQATILVGTGFDCAKAQLDRAPGLRAIIVLTIGHEGVDVDEATSRNILVVNGQTPENYQSMAEATLLLILAALYDLDGAQNRLRNGQWHVQGQRSRMLKGKTLGIIGYGNIARSLIKRLQGWEVSTLVHTRRPPAATGYGEQFVPLETLIAQSDIVVPLASLNSTSVHLLDAERLGRMKPGAILVNTARGGLIDERALVPLVRSGRISAIALDVFEAEPLSCDSPLLDLPNAILTPHDIGHTRESSEGMMRTGIDHLVAVSCGTIPAAAINADALAEWSL